MEEQTRRCGELLLENRKRMKAVFSWESGLIQLACAGIYTAKGKMAEESALQEAKRLLKQKAGIFSNFRSTAKAPVVCMAAVTGTTEAALDNGLKVYDLLKQEFCGSAYLPLAAMVIAERTEPYRYAEIAARTHEIYRAIKDEHPFLTSGEDSAFCALMALSEKTNTELLAEAESCYHLLKGEFFSSNAVQSLSHVLALCGGTPKEKCQKTMELFEVLKAEGCRYGTGYELPTLGTLALSREDVRRTAKEVAEADAWLSGQRGFGFFSSITKKQRLMYAGILTQEEPADGQTSQTAVISSSVSMILAQEAAMCAAIAASTAAANASASSNN